MVFLAWALVLAPASFALWVLAAFLVRGRGPLRIVASVLIPAIAVAGFLYVDYWSKRVPPPEPGWDIFYALASLVAGGATLAVTVPVMLLAERFLGKRAP